jgi:hypothetical protein
LGNLVKKQTLKRLIESQNLDIMLLKEYLGQVSKLAFEFEKMFGEWELIYVDIRGKTRGLITRWRYRVLAYSDL